MIKLFGRLLAFAGEQRRSLILSFVFTVFNAMFETLPLMAILVVLIEVLDGLAGRPIFAATAWVSLSIMVVSLTGQIVLANCSSLRRTIGSFDMCSQKRLEIGERLKRTYMGFFDEREVGAIAAAATTTLEDIETKAVSVLEIVAGGFIQAVVITAWLLAYEWRLGLVSIVGLICALLLYSLSQKVGDSYSPRRQAAQANLVSAVLEHVQGMAVVKAFGLGTRTARKVDAAIDESTAANVSLERAFTSVAAAYQSVFKLVRAAFLVIAPYLLLIGDIAPEKCLMLLVASFMVYSAVEVAGSVTSIARAIDASLDRVDEVMDMPRIDEDGADIKLDRFDIELVGVSFSYGDDAVVIDDVSLAVPEKTTCAIVGPSGSGKTTLCNLIARFWDVRKGRIAVGGVDVRDITCDSLLTNFSIVFQNVYLFNDTIENNIRIGRRDATDEDVREAARRACCHEFISALPDGYQTMVGEGGSSLSGGERQRISIARALLKDAPIVILDEATASVDPENERELQKAIAELTRGKTLLMIAHHLATVRDADQIVVLDKGRIVQRGTHAELMGQGGLYRQLVSIRQQASGWAIRREAAG